MCCTAAVCAYRRLSLFLSEESLRTLCGESQRIASCLATQSTSHWQPASHAAIHTSPLHCKSAARAGRRWLAGSIAPSVRGSGRTGCLLPESISSCQKERQQCRCQQQVLLLSQPPQCPEHLTGVRRCWTAQQSCYLGHHCCCWLS